MSNDLTEFQGIHPLVLYTEKYQLSYRQLAELLKLSRQTIYNYIEHRNHPSQQIKEQIAFLTNQEVPLDSWPPGPSRKPRGLTKQSVRITVPNHPLEAYRQSLGITYLRLAKLLDLNYETLYSYLSGKISPRIQVKEKIALLTDQEVPVESWPLSSKRRVGRPQGIGKRLKNCLSHP